MTAIRRPSTLRGLVWVLRFLGLYCFKKSPSSASADATEISLPFLLWAIFVKLIQLSQSIVYFVILRRFPLADVASMLSFLSAVIGSWFIFVTQILLLINGPILTEILLKCEEEPCHSRHKSVTSSSTIFSTELIVNLMFYCSCAVGLAFPFAFLLEVPVAFIMESIFSVFYTVYNFGSMVSVVLLFRQVLTIASQKLDFENNLDDDDAGLGRRLNVLEKTIRKVRTEMTTFLPVLLCSLSTPICTHILHIVI